MSSVKKIYGIKTTDKETLRRWYYLLYLGRCLMKRRPATCYSLSGGSSTPPTLATMVSSSLSDRSSSEARTISSSTTVTYWQPCRLV